MSTVARIFVSIELESGRRSATATIAARLRLGSGEDPCRIERQAAHAGTSSNLCIPRVRLTQIFREAQQSGIVVNAYRINHGQPPTLTGFPDFYSVGCDPPQDSGLHPAEQTAKLVVDVIARRIPAI
jgi:hypothetical protein